MIFFQGSEFEKEILGLIQYAIALGRTIESIYGPAMSLEGKTVSKIFGYKYSISPSKRIYISCL